MTDLLDQQFEQLRGINPQAAMSRVRQRLDVAAGAQRRHTGWAVAGAVLALVATWVFYRRDDTVFFVLGIVFIVMIGVAVRARRKAHELTECSRDDWLALWQQQLRRQLGDVTWRGPWAVALFTALTIWVAARHGVGDWRVWLYGIVDVGLLVYVASGWRVDRPRLKRELALLGRAHDHG